MSLNPLSKGIVYKQNAKIILLITQSSRSKFLNTEEIIQCAGEIDISFLQALEEKHQIEL